MLSEARRKELMSRHYSGNVYLRLSPDLHRRLTLEAKAQGVTLNHWVTERLALLVPPKPIALL